MQTSVVTCDRCQVTIVNDNRLGPYDLCGTCYAAFQTFMANKSAVPPYNPPKA